MSLVACCNFPLSCQTKWEAAFVDLCQKSRAHSLKKFKFNCKSWFLVDTLLFARTEGLAGVAEESSNRSNHTETAAQFVTANTYLHYHSYTYSDKHMVRLWINLMWLEAYFTCSNITRFFDCWSQTLFEVFRDLSQSQASTWLTDCLYDNTLQSQRSSIRASSF